MNLDEELDNDDDNCTTDFGGAEGVIRTTASSGIWHADPRRHPLGRSTPTSEDEDELRGSLFRICSVIRTWPARMVLPLIAKVQG